MNKNNKERGVSGIAVIGIVAAVVAVVIMFGYFVNSKQSQKNAAMVEKEKMEQQAIEYQKATDEKITMDKNTTEEKSAMMQDSESMMDKKEESVMKSGSYEAYSVDKVATASDAHDVVLFFRASWCPSCITVDKDIKANLSKIPANLTILDVNYDNSSELKKKYGVTYQHTFVQVSKDGSLIKKWSGSPTLASLVSEVK